MSSKRHYKLSLYLPSQWIIRKKRKTQLIMLVDATVFLHSWIDLDQHDFVLCLQAQITKQIHPTFLCVWCNIVKKVDHVNLCVWQMMWLVIRFYNRTIQVYKYFLNGTSYGHHSCKGHLWTLPGVLLIVFINIRAWLVIFCVLITN